ncbi:MAG: hypothetical protein IJT56_04655, partial [Clostridia bacterium]|nr:hypothetical protein [Clostridia bacterium]
MNKLISLLLALLMIAAAAVSAVGAQILYEDDFEGPDFNFYDHSTGEGFWFTNDQTGGSGMGKFEQSNGCLNGWEDAQNGFCQYFDGGEEMEFGDKFPCLHEFTEWFDLKLDEGGVGETYCFGLVFSDGYDAKRGFTTGSDHYYAALYAKDESNPEDMQYGFARLTYNTPRRDRKLDVYPKTTGGDYILGTYNIPEMTGFNLDGDAVRLGVRFGRGNITMYANGKIVASYDRETIGLHTTPAVWLQNGNCYMELDNYALATYDHDVKKATRTDDYD